MCSVTSEDKRSGSSLATRSGVYLAERERLRGQAATDEQLSHIWQLWHALPRNMGADRKFAILKGGRTQKHWKSLRKLGAQFPKSQYALIPDCPTSKLFEKERQRASGMDLCRAAYYQALQAARVWCNLTAQIRGTYERLREKDLQEQLAYATFDDVLSGRVALHRTAMELRYTHEDLLERTTPKVAEVHHLLARYSAYLQARQDAVNLLQPLIFVPSLISKDLLSPDQQAFGVPSPPENFPLLLYMARLARLGKCSYERLKEFMTESFLKLSHQEKLAFCNEYHKPAQGRACYWYLYLWVWIADNAPVFSQFGARWLDIFNMAQDRFNQNAPQNYRLCPKDAGQLKALWKQFSRKHLGKKQRIIIKSGRPATGERCTVPEFLLTPLPFVPVPQKG